MRPTSILTCPAAIAVSAFGVVLASLHKRPEGVVAPTDGKAMDALAALLIIAMGIIVYISRRE